MYLCPLCSHSKQGSNKGIKLQPATELSAVSHIRTTSGGDHRLSDDAKTPSSAADDHESVGVMGSPAKKNEAWDADVAIDTEL